MTSRFIVRCFPRTCMTFLLVTSVWFIVHCEGARSGVPRWWNVIELLPVKTSSEMKSEVQRRPSIPCSKIPGLLPSQLRICRSVNSLMESIAEGVWYGINECKFQLSGRRWNCSTLRLSSAKSFKKKSIFGAVLDTPSREAAFVHAITSAAIAYIVTKSCSSGSLTTCGCGRNDPDAMVALLLRTNTKLVDDWIWGGCNDNISYGVDISREFADAGDHRPTARSLMNKHNNEAGRQILLNNTQVKCKCHGLSGSCQQQTCWISMPAFRVVGNALREKHASAKEMVKRKYRDASGKVETLDPKHRRFTDVSSQDLIYYKKSPEYCRRNRKTGILGTKGRQCNDTSEGIDGCKLLCCQRGYVTNLVTVSERCKCVFHWCCHVTCEECSRQVFVSTCK